MSDKFLMTSIGMARVDASDADELLLRLGLTLTDNATQRRILADYDREHEIPAEIRDDLVARSLLPAVRPS